MAWFTYKSKRQSDLTRGREIKTQAKISEFTVLHSGVNLFGIFAAATLGLNYCKALASQPFCW